MFYNLVAKTLPFHELSEKERFQCIGNQDCGSHTYQCAHTDGMDGRMFGEKKRHDNDHEHESREENRHLMRFQQVFRSCPGFGEQAFHDKYAVIHSDSEDECRYDNVDEVELYAAERHDTFHDIPAEEHRHECYQGHEDVAERQQQYEQHEERRNHEDDIEIIMDDGNHLACVIERVCDNDARQRCHSCAYFRPVGLRDSYRGEYQEPAVIHFLDKRRLESCRKDFRIIKRTWLV